MRDTDGTRDGGLGVGIHGEGGQAVDVGGRESRVGQRRGDRLGGQTQFAAAGILGEIGSADTDDRRPPRQPFLLTHFGSL